MKRWMWILIMILALQLGENTGIKLEELKPVQLLQVQRQGDEILLRTDTEDWGRGRTMEEALKDLKSHASGKIFLETADQLLLTEGTEYLIPEIRRFLRPAVTLIGTGSAMDLQKAGAFLRVHRTDMTLGRYQNGKNTFPVLRQEKGRMVLGRNH